MSIAYYCIMGLSLLICLVSFIPLIRNDYWIFRIFEFPRAQKWVINLTLLIALVVVGLLWSDKYFPWVLGALIINQVYLSYQIIPFTKLSGKQVKTNTDPTRPCIRMLVSNVYQYNRKSDLMIRRLKDCSAEIMIFVETDAWWRNKLATAFGDDFPHQVLQDLENTYGILLFSKYELEDARVRYTLKDEIPSISAIIKHPRAGKIQLYAIHPEPPFPTENPKSTARDGEILLTGKELKDSPYPVVVAGDLNDVAWSYSTELFLKTSGMLDPRRGRGMFSTFHAEYPFLRWPLDHIFCSSHFQLNAIQCLPYVGSDHLPVYIDLAILETKDHEQESLDADKEDHEFAEEKIEVAEEEE